MRLVRILVITLVALALVAAIATVTAIAALRQTQPGLRAYFAAFPPDQHAALLPLTIAAEELDQLAPLGDPAPPPTPVKFVLDILKRENADALLQAQKDYRVAPMGHDPEAELEIAAFRHAADDALVAGIGIDQLIALASTAQSQRATLGYSVPLLALHNVQPNWRAVVSGRALKTPHPLKRGRAPLRSASVPAAAPLDPLYPLATAAITGPEGLGSSLAWLTDAPWEDRRKVEVAFALGNLFWWSADPDIPKLYAVLAEDSSGDPLLRFAALEGAVEGLNGFRRANEQLEHKADMAVFVTGWADVIESPWADAAASAYHERGLSWSTFYLLARCPAEDGYLDRIDRWATTREPGELLMLRAYFAQAGYVAYFLQEHPGQFVNACQQTPFEEPALNSDMFYSWGETAITNPAVVRATWEPMMTAGFRGDSARWFYLVRGFGAEGAGDWRILWPDIARHIEQMSDWKSRERYRKVWPLHNDASHAAFPEPGSIPPGERDVFGVEDVALMTAVDTELRRLWPTASPAFKVAIIEDHLPRLIKAGVALNPWRAFAPEIAPELIRIHDPAINTALSTALGLPASHSDGR